MSAWQQTHDEISTDGKIRHVTYRHHPCGKAVVQAIEVARRGTPHPPETCTWCKR